MSFDIYIETLKELHSQIDSKQGLEIGLAWGHSARAYVEAHPEGTLYSIDPENNFNVSLGSHHNWIKGKSPGAIPEMKFDFIFIDGDHSYESVVSDIKACLPKLEKGGVIAFDDYGRPDMGVTQAVDELIKGEPFFNKNFIRGYRI